MSGAARQLFDPEAPPLDAVPEPQAGTVAPEAAPGDEPGERSGILSIGRLYEEVEGALTSTFPGTGHCGCGGRSPTSLTTGPAIST